MLSWLCVDFDFDTDSDSDTETEWPASFSFYQWIYIITFDFILKNDTLALAKYYSIFPSGMMYKGSSSWVMPTAFLSDKFVKAPTAHVPIFIAVA